MEMAMPNDAARPLIEGNDPFTLFAEWFAEASASEANDPNAMNLASVGEGGRVSSRIVLLKSFDANGFCFFTNTHSRKGQQLAQHSQAALCFHWKSLRRQVRIEGVVQPVSDAEADEYFATRPRGSQIGAWASQQSEALDSPETLKKRVAEFEKKFEGQNVPRPAHWSGYRVAPDMIEFWQDMPFRLHDRLVFTRQAHTWDRGRRYP